VLAGDKILTAKTCIPCLKTCPRFCAIYKIRLNPTKKIAFMSLVLYSYNHTLLPIILAGKIIIKYYYIVEAEAVSLILDGKFLFFN
jgi:hypothetical protein